MENEKGAGGAKQTPAKVPATPEEQQQQGAAEQQQQNPFPAGNVDTQRFLFLDVDGVLHPTSCLTKEAWFDERCMANFKRIVDATQCRIVLSSTWRLVGEQRALLNAAFVELGVGAVAAADCTRDCAAKGRTGEIVHQKAEPVTRAEEICKWLWNAEGSQSATWVVLDDLRMEATWEFNCTDGLASIWCQQLDGHFVRTDQQTGLTAEDAEHAIQILLAA